MGTPTNVVNFQVAIDVMGWMQPLRAYFIAGEKSG